MTRYISRFCTNVEQKYDRDLIECHGDVCRQMEFVGNNEHNEIVWTYFGTDYLVVCFSNPGLVLAFNLNTFYYQKQMQQNQIYNFETFVLSDLLDPRNATIFEENITKPTFKEFIRQFNDITAEAYQVIDHVFPPLRLKLKHQYTPNCTAD